MVLVYAVISSIKDHPATIVSFPATESGNEHQTMNKRKTFNFQKNSMYMGSIKSKLYPNVLTILASLAK